MALSKDAYQALEDIVGQENISQEPVILDSYARQQGSVLVTPGGSQFQHRPEAAVLPGSTEEVQAIVRICNRYKIRCKAFGTGWAMVCAPYTENVIQLDMRRMNRILEIDEQNMFAVVEPYVIGATLQAEAMKLGLNCHIIGAGASCSIVATSTSLAGMAPDGIFMGHSAENVLGIEWVMPTGDILRTGSLGSGLGWFCGEGPGPSVRGVIRGIVGASGGMGVFTKCAVKLYPWPGPPVMPIEGVIPSYNTSLPDNFRAYTLAFPTWQAYFDAIYKIYDAGIGYIAHAQFSKFGENLGPAFVMMYTDPTKTLDDLEEMLKDPEIQRLTAEMEHSFQIVLAGMTPRDIEYQERVLDEILAETGGWKVATMAEPAMQRWLLLYLIRLPFKNLNFVFAGGYTSCFAQHGTPDFVMSYVEVGRQLKKKHIKKGGIVDDGGNAGMYAISAVGGGGDLGLEEFIHYDTHDPESVKAVLELDKEAGQIIREMKLGPGLDPVPAALRPKEVRDLMLSGGAQPAAYHWQRKIKESFNPNDIGDGGYLWLEEPGKEEH